MYVVGAYVGAGQGRAVSSTRLGEMVTRHSSTLSFGLGLAFSEQLDL